MKQLFTSKPLTVPELFRILLGLGIIALTWYFMHGADHFLELTPEALHKYFKLRWILIAHITFGGMALVLGAVQFWERFRNYSWKLHRLTGKVYLLAILISGSCAVILSFTTAYAVNWAYAFSLQVWVSVWMSSSFIAYRTAVKKQFKQHREWMTRSYIVTLAFIVSALIAKLPVVSRLGSFADVSPSLFWLGWAGPLYLYQVILSVKRS